MYQSIFYKEWVKTSKIIILLILVLTAAITYLFIDILHQLRLSGAVAYVESIIQKDIELLPLMKYLPVLAGMLLAIGQYVPEMQNKRFKLTLHLPLSERAIISAMLWYGILVLSGIFLLSFTPLLIGLRFLFPPEIVWANFLSALPWFLAGWTGYFIASWIILEPVWLQRVKNAIPGLCSLSFFFMTGKSGGFIPFLPWLAGFIVVAFSFSYYSAFRFKTGAQ